MHKIIFRLISNVKSFYSSNQMMSISMSDKKIKIFNTIRYSKVKFQMIFNLMHIWKYF